MNTHILKVLSQTEAVTLQKQDGSTIQKSTIVLQELGGKYEDSYACTLLGNAALCKFYPGDLVCAALRFQHHEYQGSVYQDVTVQDIVPVAKG